jgi:hypothetical protein
MRTVTNSVMFRDDVRDVHVAWFDDAAEAARTMGAAAGDRNFGYSDWLGGETCAEAVRYAIAGNERLVRDAERVLSQIDANVDTRGFERQASPCGAFPVVPEFIAGHPACMRRNMPIERGPVRLIMDTTSSGGIDAATLHTRGTVLLALAMVLMAEGRPVELHWTCALDAPGGASAVVVRCPTQPVNVGVCCHLVTSQAWVRGLGYGYLMREFGASGSWPFNTAPCAAVTAAMREAYAMNPADVYIPAIYVHDDMVRRPIAWINKQLAQFREEQS